MQAGISGPTSTAPIGAVLFDYGLVLTGPPDAAAWERLKRTVNAEEPEFHAAYWRHRHQYDLGALSGTAYWRAVAGDLRHPLEEPGLAALIADDTALWTQPNRPMIDWATDLQRRGVRTGILSNLGDAMEEGVLRACPWMGDFAHRTFTHRIGMAKPEPGAYLHAIEGMGLPPGKILFVDDREENVAAAEAAGLRALRYADHEHFLRALDEAGYSAQLGSPAVS